MVSNQKLFLLGLPPTSRALSGNLLPWPPPLSSEGLYRGNHARSSQVLTTTEVSPLHQQNPPFPTCRWEKLQLLKTVTKIEKPRVFVALAATERMKLPAVAAFPGKWIEIKEIESFVILRGHLGTPQRRGGGGGGYSGDLMRECGK